MKNIAVILAAGSGVRSGFNTSKQLVKLAGRPVAIHTLRAFESSISIHEIIIVTNKENYSEIERLVYAEGFKKVKKIILGGHERWESSWAAIQSCRKEPNLDKLNLIFHDAVRPLVDDFIINRVVEALGSFRAIDVVINTVDTIVQTDNSGQFIEKILDRSKLRNGQTPQAFKYSVIREAYEKAINDPEKIFTDDCGIVMKYLPNEKIYLVDGSTYNHKLTYNEDLAILDKLFQLKRNLMTTSLSDKELSSSLKCLKDKVVVVFGGKSGIGKEISNLLERSGIKVLSASRKNGCDISKISDVKNFLEKVYSDFGRVDYVVNSAGILTKQPLSLMKYDDIIESVNINYLGVINVAYASFEYLRKTKGGLLLFTSSSYTYGRAYYSLYSSSKAAVVNFVQAISEEWIDFGISVNCISPERTNTPMRVAAFGAEDKQSLLDPADVAKASIKTLCMGETGLIIDVKKPF